ncbi:MAG: TerD family protein [Pseudomonadota bacterium]
MATQLTEGANAPLPGDEITLDIGWQGSGSVPSIDVSAFALKADGKVRGDADMIFYNQPEHSGGAVRMRQTGSGTSFSLRMPGIPAALEKIAVTATVDPASGVANFGGLSTASIVIRDGGGAEAVRFDMQLSGRSEAALILGEIYRRQGQWKFRAVGQGFNGGLKPLAEHFGVDVAGDPEPAAPPPSSPPPSSRPPSSRQPSSPPKQASTPPASNVSLSKISLSKDKPTVSLKKGSGGSLGMITINLNWNQGEPKKAGLFGLGKPKGIDLDLCALYRLADGRAFGVQALGNNFGSYNNAPWIELAGDDRTGSATDGEWMRVNGDQWDKIGRVLVYAMIYEGVPNWSSTDGVVTLFAPNNPDIEVRMEGTSNERICAVALLENVGGELKITRENRYFANAPEMDRAYGFGLNWTSGRK